MIWRATAVRGGIGDSTSSFFLCKIRFNIQGTYNHNIRSKGHQKYSQKADPKGGWGEANAYGQPDCKNISFFMPPLRKATKNIGPEKNWT